MSLRSVHILPLATILLLGSPSAPEAKPQGTYTLHIEALGQSPVTVRITTTNSGVDRRGVPQRDTVLEPPINLPIADSVRRVHVVVIGFASVRVTLTNSAERADSLVSVGRDITLARKEDRRFARIWTAQPLVP